jgi:citrate synthase
MPDDDKIQIKRGLNGVYFDSTKASFIDGEEGKLLYRGYNIHDLAEQSTFEEVVYLLLYGKLPNRIELNEIMATLQANRDIPDYIYEIIRMIKNSHPMDVLRTAISALSANDPDSENLSPESIIRIGLELTAKAPTIVCAHYRISEGLDPVAPNTSLNHASNFLYMLKGEMPSDEEARTMDVDFVLHAEHGANASSFAARVAAGTQTDFYSVIVAAVSTLKGPSHGGAAESVMNVAIEIGDPENAREFVERTLGSGGRIMGFGHRVYKAADPRARHLKAHSQRLGEQYGDPKWFQILAALDTEMEPYQKRGIWANVDFFAGSIYHLFGIPKNLFISIFAMGRIPGWTLQALEQYTNNILIRPLLNYTGEKDLTYIPIDERE